jgi:hypothetical protein
MIMRGGGAKTSMNTVTSLRRDSPAEPCHALSTRKRPSGVAGYHGIQLVAPQRSLNANDLAHQQGRTKLWEQRVAALDDVGAFDHRGEGHWIFIPYALGQRGEDLVH